MNVITKTPSPNRFLAPSIDRDACLDLAAVMNRMVRDYPSAPAILLEPIAPEIRHRLDARRQTLELALAPASRSDHPHIARAIASLLGGFAAASAGSPEATVAKYVQVLADLPVWVILKACQMLENGEVEGASLDFRPSAPRIKNAARELLEPWIEEMFHLRAVLSAPALEPEDAETRGRVGKLMREFADNWRAGRRYR